MWQRACSSSGALQPRPTGSPSTGHAVDRLSNGQGWAVQNDSVTDTALVAPEPTVVIDRSCQNAQSCVYEVRAFTAAGPSGHVAAVTVGG